jgi:cell division protein FtsW (lipid II flippase)
MLNRVRNHGTTRRDWSASAAPLLRRMPWPILVLALLLLVAGWLGIGRSLELSGSQRQLVRQQILWSVLSLAAMGLAAWPNYRLLGRWSYALFGTLAVLLVVVYAFPRVNGAHRWIRWGPLGFQPSEFVKLAYVLMLARYLMYRDNFRRPLGLVVPFALTSVPVFLILREPDLGTATIFLPLLLLMLLTAGARRCDMALAIGIGIVLLPVLWSQMSREQRSRVAVLFSQTDPGETPTADGYHLHQAKQLSALGGVWGSWLTGEVTEDRAVYHVPEGATDSIYAILTERYGLVGAGSLLALYVLLVWRGLLVAERTHEPFGRLIAAGISLLFAVEAIVNTGMMVGLLPITGLSLPLVSYGGSGMLAHALGLGLLLNVSLRPGFEVADEPFRYVA